MTRTEPDQRLYLHVGVPKSGTTFLQSSLARNRDALRRQGVLYPGDAERMFLAALDVRGAHKAWGRKRKDVEGSWDALCSKARKHSGTTVISHELLGAASTRQITAAFTMLRGLEVHVIVTARDPASQAASEWQEGIKHGRRLTFDQFREKVLKDPAETEEARRYKAAHDLPELLARWGSQVPAHRVHLVCAPATSAEPAILWNRFAAVIGVDPVRDRAAGPSSANASLGVQEIDLLRRVNIALDKRVVQPEYGEVVKRFYAQELLAAHPSPKPVVPADLAEELGVTARRWAKEIAEGGYCVHGDLDDLLPTDRPTPSPHPDLVDPPRQVERAVSSTADLLVELVRCRAEVSRLEEDNAALRRRRRRLKRKLKAATVD